MQEDVFSGTEPELDDVLLHEFNIFFGFDTLVIDVSAVSGLQVDDVRSNAPDVAAVLLGRDQPVLEGGVLLGARRMVDRNVGHLPIAAEQVTALPVYVQHGQLFLAFERVQPPPAFRFPRLSRLTVLDHHAVERVRVFRQLAGGLEIRFFLLRRRLLSLMAGRLSVPGSATPLVFRVRGLVPVSRGVVVVAAAAMIIGPRSLVVPAVVVIVRIRAASAMMMMMMITVMLLLPFGRPVVVAILVMRLRLRQWFSTGFITTTTANVTPETEITQKRLTRIRNPCVYIKRADASPD